MFMFLTLFSPGYLDYIKDLQKSTDTLDLNEPEVPEHISKAACYIEDAYDGRLNNGKGTMSETSKKIQLLVNIIMCRVLRILISFINTIL